MSEQAPEGTESAPEPGRSGRLRRAARWVLDTRVVSLVLAAVLIAMGIGLSTTPGATFGDIRELPGQVSGLIQQVLARPEAGYPRIRADRVGVDLLLVKGDGKNPPVKYEAFTYPGADYLLSDHPGGGNSYVYAHARTGMFWNLHNMSIGDVVTVDYGAGKVLRYRVSEIHSRVKWTDLEWLQPTTDDRLTLQTCNGWKDDDPRFVVVALRIPDQTALR